ncbi:hypothetical protein ABK040_016174 [Willaertia magna]
MKGKSVFILSSLFSVTLTVGYNGMRDPNSNLYSNIILPTLMKMDPERAHNLSKFFMKIGLHPKEKKINVNDPIHDPNLILHTKVFDKYFDSPIGLAAGFDKDAECMDAIKDIGFGFMEIGSVCPKEQPEEGSYDTIINRCGFNSKGMDVVEGNLKRYKKKRDFPVGVNLGKNKTSDPESVEDYLIGVERLTKYADFLVINISSPNTQHLRSLQEKNALDILLSNVKSKLSGETLNKPKVPLLVKIAPDLTLDQQRDIASLILKHNIDGVIVSNTTIERPYITKEQLDSLEGGSHGGLSGKPLFDKSNKVLRNMYKLTEGKVTLIGVGGVFDGKDALEKIENGASLVQIYTSFTSKGPSIVGNIKYELADLLREQGYKNINDAKGKKAKYSKLEE